MSNNNLVEGKDKNQILDELSRREQTGGWQQEQRMMGIIVRCTEDIEKVINDFNGSLTKNTDTNNKIANRLLWLNIVLAGLTVISILIAIIQ